MPCFGSWKASEIITAIFPTGTLPVCAAARWAPAVAQAMKNTNKKTFLLIISITPPVWSGKRCRRRCPSAPAACPGKLANLLRLRRQRRGRRILTIEFCDESLGDIQRSVRADNALDLGHI